MYTGYELAVLFSDDFGSELSICFALIAKFICLKVAQSEAQVPLSSKSQTIHAVDTLVLNHCGSGDKEALLENGES
jgi:hypothetical protein